ncbi:dihydropteroate synthase [Luteirhabdus pelagi]|jgi:dihydropteroate synthase|uniref:dihydropteroate synthase n=1 Tax=Luteirhabdus pelagi TaxID=2792783 RepID=UPI001939C58F|nr:dihydropteroate synthase [Luteirhabdus pelagi]
MGIINVTPDSFYDGGSTQNIATILEQAETMLKEGATFLDIGGYSSRPGANDISISEELERVLPAIEAILKQFPDAFLSVDTFRSEIARQAVEAGVSIVNDISAGKLDENMLKTVGSLQVPYIAMHMKGTPQTMKQHVDYSDLLKEVTYYFSERIAAAREQGINDIILDPGFGFAKNIVQNFQLLNQLELFDLFDLPLLVGISRKSTIYKTLDVSAKEALNGSTVLHTVALQKGANILRVHDVREAMECIQLTQAVRHNQEF